MSAGLTAALVIFILIFFLRMPISLGMLSAGVAYFMLSGMSIDLVTNQMMNTFYSNYVIIAVPLFIFTANVMNSCQITEYVFKFANALIGKKHGGLGHVNVVASIIFSGMTGSAVADASGLGKMEIDAMKKAGYDDGFSCAITAASATIGPVFPPSIPLVMYAMYSGASIGALFLAGTIPGLLIGVALMVYIAIIAKKRNYPVGEAFAKSQFINFTFKAMPALLTPIILLGGIYTGVMTPTEAGAVAAGYAILVGIFAYRTMNLEAFKQVLSDTVRDTGSVSLMVGAASVISFIVAKEQIARQIGDLVLGLTDNPLIFLGVVNVVILILGMFMDTSTIQLVFVPMMLPVARALGIDLIHFGIVVTLNMMIGLSTPPFGMLLFITSNVSGTPLKKVMKEIGWPILAMLVVLCGITFIPEICLFLPKMLGAL